MRETPETRNEEGSGGDMRAETKLYAYGIDEEVLVPSKSKLNYHHVFKPVGHYVFEISSFKVGVCEGGDANQILVVDVTVDGRSILPRQFSGRSAAWFNTSDLQADAVVARRGCDVRFILRNPSLSLIRVRLALCGVAKRKPSEGTA